MATRSFGEEAAAEVARKAVMWGPGIAGALLLGPVGALLGFLASVAVVETASSGSSPPASEEKPRKNQSG